MSDTYAIRRYHRQTSVAGGAVRKKKYLLLVLLFLLAGMSGLAYLVHASGFFAENNPAIAPALASRINTERQVAGLSPVQVDHSLSYLAYTKSMEVKVASLTYANGQSPNPDPLTNVIIIPRLSWAFSGKDFQQQFSGSPESRDTALLGNVHNAKFRTIGIGVSSDSYNYYIVTRWKEE